MPDAKKVKTPLKQELITPQPKDAVLKDVTDVSVKQEKITPAPMQQEKVIPQPEDAVLKYVTDVPTSQRMTRSLAKTPQATGIDA